MFMQKFSHRCIPLLLGVQLEKKPISLIMQFIGENSKSITIFNLLFDPLYQQQASKMSTKTWLCICYDIADALDHMHQRGYLHCDLKSNNVLVDENKGYLIDFGKVCEISRPKAQGRYEGISIGRVLNVELPSNNYAICRVFSRKCK
jgi:serine/threonine protein kinase